jgi:integrase
LKDYAVTNGVKEGTIRIRKNEINHLVKYFEYAPMKDIKKRDYQGALNDLKSNGYSENTISGVHATGGMIFRLAIEWELIKTDPTKGAKIPKDKLTIEKIENNEEIPKYLEKEELALFLKTAHKMGLEGDYEIFMTLAYTGMRIGELCALKRTDLDSQEETINITKTIYNPNNNIKGYKLVPPKTKKSIRNITIDKQLVDILTKLITRQNASRMKHRKTYHDKGFIFAYIESNPGFPYYIKFIENRMARLLKLANLNKELTPHSLRHTHTSLLAEAGVSLPDIMDRLGHSDDEITRTADIQHP